MTELCCVIIEFCCVVCGDVAVRVSGKRDSGVTSGAVGRATVWIHLALAATTCSHDGAPSSTTACVGMCTSTWTCSLPRSRSVTDQSSCTNPWPSAGLECCQHPTTRRVAAARNGTARVACAAYVACVTCVVCEHMVWHVWHMWHVWRAWHV
jgi:hypothetical protein